MPTRQTGHRITRRAVLISAASVGMPAIAGCTENAANGSDRTGDTGRSNRTDDTDHLSNTTDQTGNESGSIEDDESDTVEDPDRNSSLSGRISIAGSSTVYPLVTTIAEDFQEAMPTVDVDIGSTGTGGGFQNYFCPGSTDINTASRPITDEERRLCAANDIEYIELLTAMDAVTVVIHEDNDFATRLTVEELAQIWESDAAETWDEIREDWPAEPIDRYGPADTSGTYDYFIENIQGNERGHTVDYQATEQDNTIVQGVRNNQYAIGYFGFAYYTQHADRLQSVAIPDGTDTYVEPSLDAAASGDYTPLSRPLYTYISVGSLTEEHVAEFARFFVEQTGNEGVVASDVGYVPLTTEQVDEQFSKLETAIGNSY